MSLKVLIIDDNEDDRIAVRFALRGANCLVEAAPSVNRGLVTAEIFKPDVILLDYSMQDSNGIEFITLLKESYAGDLPAVVMITGVGNEVVAVQALRAGAQDYLIKDVGGNYLKLLPAVLERIERDCNQRRNRKESERMLQLAGIVYANITEGILVTDLEGCIVSANPALCSISGYSAEELVGGKPSIFKSNRHSADFYKALWESLDRDGQWSGEIWNRRKDGSVFLAKQTIIAVLDSDGRRHNYLSVMTDITDCKAAEDMLRQRAYHDDLTELPNRCLFLDRIRHRASYAQRYKSLLAILFIDLDGFKPVNDDLGHEHGDELLRQLALRLKSCLRESDTAARWGGDEFVVLLNDIDSSEHAEQVAKKILDQIRAPFNLNCYQVEISASIGIALYPEDANDIDILIRVADQAMYAAKKAGGSTIYCATKVGAGRTATVASQSAGVCVS